MFKKPPKNCLETLDVFRSRSNLYVVMKICRDGDLEGELKKKKRFTEKEATNCLLQLVNGLRELHEINFWHRDMKPANVLMEDGKYLICDYGLSTIAVHNPNSMMMLSTCGTPVYMAPEIMTRQEYNSNVDVFALGVMIYESIYGKIPWPAYTI